ncbi:pyridoxal-phosphate dependent enzyme [Actinomadura rubrisoli]|uniref:Pyridoxal-phosphate dependent enzyme n=1 Tax=Actinomadura rubrisoli TaxID=2530368 RepID=A0A4R5ABN2_9ACTN|nr:pyridoxal-phosphate dependent enzyme [Actinomadura rubrisoli]TDD69591.1 pyridoxal-phosphate dependent enzyme [Actinomadura rubrisoli]
MTTALTSASVASPLVREPWFARPAARTWTCPPAPCDVAAFHKALPGYARTPLAELPALAAELGVGRVFVKDESHRLGLPAFKILGASWGVYRALCDHYDLPLSAGVGGAPVGARSGARVVVRGGARVGDPLDPLDRLRERIGAEPPVRLVTATDGNHGRAVAAMARLLGLAADVFVPDGVHPAAFDAIKAEGARVTRIAAPYDEAVRRAARAAGTSALLIQDTGWPGYERAPRWIVEGYSTLFAEIDEQLRAAGAEPAGLVAVPAGVGSLAQAAVTHYRAERAERAGQDAPTLLSVEPEAAPCVLTSLLHDRPTTVETGSTIMAGLNCATPSGLAWPVLRAGVDAAVAVPDAAAVRAVQDLAALGVPAGPCGAASLAGVRAALTPDRRSVLAPGHASTVVLLSTEGPAANPAL